MRVFVMGLVLMAGAAISSYAKANVTCADSNNSNRSAIIYVNGLYIPGGFFCKRINPTTVWDPSTPNIKGTCQWGDRVLEVVANPKELLLVAEHYAPVFLGLNCHQ